MAQRSSRLIVPLKPNPDAATRLFCFPYAGVGGSVYREWPGHFAPSLELFTIAPPGREARFREPPFTRIEPLIDALVPEIVPLLDRPFAFFGHSLGSLVSFELCRRLRTLGHPLPVHLFVSGRRAAHWPVREERFHELTDDALLEEIRRYNGTPKEVLENRELMELVLPIVRADFAMHETYAYVAGPALDLPISAFGGAHDATVPEERLAAWETQTTRAFRYQLFPGDHFYLQGARRALAHAITEDLTQSLTATREPSR